MEVSKRIDLAWILTLLLVLWVGLPSSIAMADDTTDFGKTRWKALHDDVAAQVELGSMYAKGQGVAQDNSQAIFWYRKAAEKGDSEAQFNLGIMYDKGVGVRQDLTRAIDWYDKAAKQGHKVALANVEIIQGQIASQKSLAEQGNAEAQIAVADMYANGNGLALDYKQAVELYQKAADQGAAAAQCKLGMMFEDGKGTPQDFAQSVAWYRRAIEQNFALAKYNLGRMYLRGRGVPKDNVYAYAWMSLAADQGEKNAISNLGFAASLLTPKQLIQAQEKAVELHAEINSKK